jgi:hypothetical protein
MAQSHNKFGSTFSLFILSLFILFALGSLTVSRAPSGAWAAEGGNLLVNGDLARAAPGGLPSGWSTSALPGCGMRFVWSKDPQAPAQVGIIDSEPNVASIWQSMALKPGWYRFTGEIRTEDVSKRSGAYLYLKAEAALMELTSRPVRGTKDWRKIDLAFKISVDGHRFELGGKLGQSEGPSTGAAYFRALSLSSVSDSGNRGAFTDVDAMWRGDPQSKSLLPGFYLPVLAGGPARFPTLARSGGWGVAGLFASLILLAFAGWRSLRPVGWVGKPSARPSSQG